MRTMLGGEESQSMSPFGGSIGLESACPDSGVHGRKDACRRYLEQTRLGAKGVNGAVTCMHEC
jgi:hypothetical protein